MFRYQDTITGQFFGHNHVDEFQIFYDRLPFGKRKAINVAYVGPSTTPFKFLNPGYRIYTIDSATEHSTWVSAKSRTSEIKGHGPIICVVIFSSLLQKVLDHETYYLNLTAANLYNSPVWIKEYSAKKDYVMESLEPEEWDKLVLRFKRDEQLFDKYFK